MLLDLGGAPGTLNRTTMGAPKMIGSFLTWAWPTSCGFFACRNPKPSFSCYSYLPLLHLHLRVSQNYPLSGAVHMRSHFGPRTLLAEPFALESLYGFQVLSVPWYETPIVPEVGACRSTFFLHVASKPWHIFVSRRSSHCDQWRVVEVGTLRKKIRH